MPDSPETVKVARELETLIPAFLANRAGELEALRAALAGSDFEALRRIGHNMKGVGASYGFARISALGVQIEAAAHAADGAALAGHVAAYADYLGKVRIAYE